MNPTETKSWEKLKIHHDKIKNTHLRDLFKEKDRVKKYNIKTPEFLFDYSKHRITDETMSLLNDLVVEQNLKEEIDKMFSGDKINVTEGRSVLHTALRNRSEKSIILNGEDISKSISRVLNQMEDFSNSVRSGKHLGFTNKKIETLVNIGIGGSDLGPLMAYEALKDYSDRSINFEFVSNVDGSHLYEVLRKSNPETTLFIIASKTFTTQETMANAREAKDWILKHYNDNESIKSHFVALSTNKESVSEFGIDPKNIFEFWDWVGGRYSLSSAIGLSLMIAIGPQNFNEMLEGMYEMDEHFKNTDFECNIPVIMAVLGVWYNNFFNANTHAILPYEQYLSKFAAYFQQGDMESNGKSVDRDGNEISYETGPIIWGEPGTNGQHAFYQLIHQGTKLIPSDFICFAKNSHGLKGHHDKLIANCIAQTQALAFGKTKDELISEKIDPNLIPYKVFKGNIPSTTIFAEKLNPKTLGKLIAAYEHKIFTQGIIWNIHSFDQWGVELGKVLAKNILEEIDGKAQNNLDDSSKNLLRYYKEFSN